MSKGLEALKETAIQIVEALYGKDKPLRNNKINELLDTKQFKCIEKDLKVVEIIKELPDKYKEGLIYILLSALNERKISQEDYELLKEELL